MDASVDRVCWDWHYSWLPWRARIATSNAPRSECWKCMNFTSPFSNDEMTCKKRQTQLNSSARVWWKCGQCWNWSGLKNHFDASFGSGFDSGEFRSESASLNPQAWKTRAKRLNCKWETIMVMLFLLLMAATRLSLVSLSESLGTILVPTNTVTWQHSTALGVASLLDRTTREQLNGTLTEPGSSGAMELRTLIGTPACHAGSTAAGCTTFEPKVDNSAASSKVRTLTSDRLQQLKFICLTDCTQKFTARHEYNPSVRSSFCDLCAIHGKVSFVYSKSWNFIQRSIHVLTKSNDIFQGHLCGNCKTLLPSSWFCAGNHTRVRCLYSTDVFPDLDFCSFQGCSNDSGSEVRAISPKSSDDSLGVLMRVIYSHEARLQRSESS